MPPRAVWKGAISFGMVVIPIKLYIATESKDIAFVTLHKACSNRLRQKRHCPHCEADVEFADIVRGYEYARDQYIVVEDADLEGLPLKSTHTIEIAQFVDLPSIDPIYFERSYMLEPDGVGMKPFYLLKRALQDSQRVAIAKVALRQKEHLCCLRPYDHALSLETMYYPDEIRGTRDLNLPEEQVTVTPQEIRMATTLIDELTAPFDAARFQDDYRTALEKVIEAKLGAAQPVAAAPAPPKGKVRDLMEALKASIEAAKRERTAVAAPGIEQPEAESQAKRKVRKAV